MPLFQIRLARCEGVQDVRARLADFQQHVVWQRPNVTCAHRDGIGAVAPTGDAVETQPVGPEIAPGYVCMRNVKIPHAWLRGRMHINAWSSWVAASLSPLGYILPAPAEANH